MGNRDGKGRLDKTTGGTERRWEDTCRGQCKNDGRDTQRQGAAVQASDGVRGASRRKGHCRGSVSQDEPGRASENQKFELFPALTQQTENKGWVLGEQRAAGRGQDQLRWTSPGP